MEDRVDAARARERGSPQRPPALAPSSGARRHSARNAVLAMALVAVLVGGSVVAYFATRTPQKDATRVVTVRSTHTVTQVARSTHTVTQLSTVPQAPASRATTTSSAAAASELGVPAKTLSGDHFDMRIPASWSVVSSETVHGDLSADGYYETDAVAPTANGKVLIRIDTSPNRGDVKPIAGARVVAAYFAGLSGYQRLGWEKTSIDSLPAFRWEFVDTESGLRMHKVDLFVQDARDGVGLAILVQAPDLSFARYSGLFENIARTLTIH